MIEKETKVPKKLYRSGVDKMISGVCGGFAEYFAIDVTLVRILWVISIFLHGIGLIGYFIALIVMPENPDHAGIPRKKSTASKNSGLIVGVVLIAIGIIFLSREFYWPLYDILGPFTFYSGRMWPVLIILFGVLYLIHVVRQDKETDFTQENGQPEPAHQVKKLTRSRTNKMIVGVCGGLAQYWNIDASIVRIAYVLISILSAAFPGIIIYVILLIAIPEEAPKEFDFTVKAEAKVPAKRKKTVKKTTTKTGASQTKTTKAKDENAEQE